MLIILLACVDILFFRVAQPRRPPATHEREERKGALRAPRQVPGPVGRTGPAAQGARATPKSEDPPKEGLFAPCAKGCEGPVKTLSPLPWAILHIMPPRKDPRYRTPWVTRATPTSEDPPKEGLFAPCTKGCDGTDENPHAAP